MISYPTLITLLALSASAVLGSGQESSPISALGGPCDNGTRFSPRCGDDLTCMRFGRQPGASGMCVPLAKVNEPCNGAIRYPPQCGPEANCVMPPRNRWLAGGHGTCIAIPAKEGGRCGGGLKHWIPCEEGLTCQIFSKMIGEEIGPDGKCVREGGNDNNDDN